MERVKSGYRLPPPMVRVWIKISPNLVYIENYGKSCRLSCFHTPLKNYDLATLHGCSDLMKRSQSKNTYVACGECLMTQWRFFWVTRRLLCLPTRYFSINKVDEVLLGFTLFLFFSISELPKGHSSGHVELLECRTEQATEVFRNCEETRRPDSISW